MSSWFLVTIATLRYNIMNLCGLETLQLAQWGYTSGANVTGMGWDGTDGNQPRYSRILYNFVHEIGIWGESNHLSTFKPSLARIC